MAEAKSLTISEVVANATSGEGFDFLLVVSQGDRIRAAASRKSEASASLPLFRRSGSACSAATREGQLSLADHDP